MNMWLARGRAPLRAPALVCRPRTLLHMHMSEAMHVRSVFPFGVSSRGPERSATMGRFPVRVTLA